MKTKIQGRRSEIKGRRLTMATAVLWLTLMGYVAQAQNFTLDWFKLGGGGMSAGSAYTVRGTIGQPDAGRLSGAQFVLDGGFWHLESPGCDCGLSIRLSNDRRDVIITWPACCGGWVLESTAELRANPTETKWDAVNPQPTSHTYITPGNGPRRFFRLRCP